mgnify:CR=1 FL=1
MTLELRRVIVFTAQLSEMEHFYRNVIGLEVTRREDGWVEFAAGACSLALHAGPSKVGSRSPKLVFFAADVAGARATLLKQGLARAGQVKSTAHFDMCDFKDPDGNRLQVSSRQ